MDTESPRIPSAFPKSPAPLRSRPSASSSTLVTNPSPALAVPKASSAPGIVPGVPPLEPLIPYDVVDAPTQRLYAVGVFVLLQAWKGYDVGQLYAGDVDSVSELGFCIKWLLMDGCFFWFLPLLRIPWLTLSQSVTLGLIGAFSALDIILSLRYQVPVTALLAGLWKLFYDRELSISEKSVKWYDIVHNNSHIQGKYTVHILPEGAAKLNPDGDCFCLGPASPTVTVPIRINGSQPIYIQLLRRDFQTGEFEQLDISSKELKKLFKRAPPEEEDPALRYLPYTIKKPGVYRLAKVKDISELDVRVQRSEAVVVQCPVARIEASAPRGKDACKGDVSDLSVVVEGIAPLKLRYSREMKGVPHLTNVERIHPENYQSPSANDPNSSSETEQTDIDLKWGQRRIIKVPINESLGLTGEWMYEIAQVGDACGNVVDYTSSREDGEPWAMKQGGLSHRIIVHPRPLVHFDHCDPQHAMQLPSNQMAGLPLEIEADTADGPFMLEYAFTPSSKLGPAAEHATDHVLKKHQLKAPTELVLIKEPGLYSLRSMSGRYCSSQILEPSTCLVVTPPRPSMSMEYDEIVDKCTKSSTGLTIDLTLVGTPPFDVAYRVVKDGGAPEVKVLHVERTRYQFRFMPEETGHYAYEFFQLDDKNYNGVKVDSTVNRVEQTVKPLAGASFMDLSPRRKCCIEESVDFNIKLQGTPPLTLNYDLIHNGRSRRLSESNITTHLHTIRTPSLVSGGDYSLALTSIEDQSGCKISLESEAKISVRFQRPKAQFGALDGKMSAKTLEGKEVGIPLRLTGEKPWFVKFRNIDRDDTAVERTFRDPNSLLHVRNAGTYQIEEVRDSGCPGIIPNSESKFSVTWLDRPQIRLPVSSSILTRGDAFVRKDVCEGDEDAVELAFTGLPPFTVDYDRHYKPDSIYDTRRGIEKSQLKFTAGLSVSTLRLETSRSGLYTYQFHKIADGIYNDPKDANIKNPIVLEQTVHSRPSTIFAQPAKVYKYCLDSGAGDDTIPIQLVGVPPFALTINIKHFSNGKSEVVNVPHVDSNSLDFRIPPHFLTLGDHAVSVLKVKDARSCVRKTPEGAPHVMVRVADLPTITAADNQEHYCVGDRLAFALAGVPPFAVEYEWNGVLMKAANQPSQFVRVAERPGNFTITALQDSASDCKVHLGTTKLIHEVPSVIVSEGTSVVKGIPEGDQAEIHFRFFGTPPFTFTYTRSEISKRGIKPRILEMHSQSTDNHEYSMFASQEGTYEVIAIEDRFCGYSAATAGRKT